MRIVGSGAAKRGKGPPGAAEPVVGRVPFLNPREEATVDTQILEGPVKGGAPAARESKERDRRREGKDDRDHRRCGGLPVAPCDAPAPGQECGTAQDCQG